MRLIPGKELDDQWLKASVVGSLWASVEIVAGSFLHNLHVPFSGTILTAFSVFLLVAFLQLWPDRGILWRAGLICALMKSLSPSAVILGPMIGILSEAVILWLFVRLLGRNLFSLMLGGALAVTSALIHKVVSLLILYGFDLVKVADGLYQYSARQVSFVSTDPSALLSAIVAIYLVLGTLSALAGYLTARKIELKGDGGTVLEDHSVNPHSLLFKHTSKRKYSSLLLVMHLVIIALCLWLLGISPAWPAFTVSAIYIISCLTWYGQSMRFLKKTGFWIQFVVITFLASLVIESINTHQFLSLQGFIIGLKMNFRAFLLMTGFTAISIELKNPFIKTVLYNRGFASVYQSLNLAFSALPGIISSLPPVREFFRNRHAFLFHLFRSSHELMARFGRDHKERSSVIIVTGGIGRGKTTFLSEAVALARTRGLTPAGILAPGEFIEGAKEGFYLENIADGTRQKFAARDRHEGWIKGGHYYFDPAVLEHGLSILAGAVNSRPSFVIVDEVGPMEMNDMGWATGIERLCSSTGIPLVWAVRESLVEAAARKWNVGDVYIARIHENTVAEVVALLEKLHEG